MTLVCRIRIARIALGAALLASTATAADFRAAETIVIAAGETVSDDLFATAGKIEIAGRIEGDLIAFAGEIYLTGEVTGDVFLACGQAHLTGRVGEDAHVTSGELRISGRLGDDLLAAAGEIAITSEAEIGGDVRVAAGELSIAGRTQAVRAVVGELSIAETAVIEGDVEYTSADEARVAPGARTGMLTQSKPPPEESRVAKAFSVGAMLAIAAGIFTALVLATLAPRTAARIAGQWRGHFGASIAWGAIALFGIPIAAGIAMITIVGLPLGVGVLLLYLVLYLGWISGMLGLGGWVSSVDKSSGRPHLWAAIAIGALAVFLLRLVPVAGGLLAGAIFMAGLGALLRALARRSDPAPATAA